MRSSFQPSPIPRLTNFIIQTVITKKKKRKEKTFWILYRLPQACPCVIKVGLSNKSYKRPRRQHSCPVSMTSHNRPIWLVTLAPLSSPISGNQRKANMGMSIQRHRQGPEKLCLESFHKIGFLAKFLLLMYYSQEVIFFFFS